MEISKYSGKIYLKIDQKVIIRTPDRPFLGDFPSRVDAIDEQTITLYAPIDREGNLPVKAGELIAVDFFDNIAMYSFESEITGIISDSHVPLIVINRPSEIKKIQRREFVRVAASLPVAVTRPAISGNTIEMTFETTSIDISGSGILITSPVKIKEGEHLRLKITLPDQEVETEGTVIRTLPNPSSQSYPVGIRYENIPEYLRDRIIAFVFDRQLELRKLGLLKR